MREKAKYSQRGHDHKRHCIQDQSQTEKRIKALNALTKVIAGSGFVILPYYIYPNLYSIIKNLMKFEQNQQIRKEALRLMGAIGAIDPHLFKKVQNREENTSNLWE